MSKLPRKIFLPSREFIFKGLEHVSKALGHMFTDLVQVFQGLKHKILLGGNNFQTRFGEKFVVKNM